MKKRTWKRVIIALFAVIIIVLFLLPIIARKTIVKNSKEWIGRQIAIDDVSFNYLTGTLRVTGFKMFEANEQDIFVSFDTLLVDAEPHRLLINEFVLDKVYLHGLDTKIIFKDSTFNFDDLVAFYSIPEEDRTMAEPMKEEPYHYKISNIEISEAEFLFDNRKIDNITRIRDLSFIIPFIGWNQEDASEAGLRFAFKNDGYFESLFHLDQKTGVFDADININKLYLETFEKYAMEYAQINSMHGIFNTRIKANGNINNPEKTMVSSFIEVLDFEMKDKADKKFLGADRITCVVKEANYAYQNYTIDTLSFTKPYVYFELKDSTNNLYRIFNIESEKSDSSAVSEVNTENPDTLSSLYYALNTFLINKGIIDYTDNITGDPFDYHLSELTINSDSIKSTSDWVTIYSQMRLNNRGKLKAELGANPTDLGNADLNFSIEEFQLSDLNIYSQFYVGHSILQGEMFYYSDSKIRNGQIESENNLLVKNVSLGTTKKGLINLPIKFALFLLKDKNGDVNLEIPVRGDLNDPSINVGKLVWHTFKNLIIKAAASPGKLLAGTVGGDPKDLEKIEFNYLDTVLTEHHIKQLDMLIKLEQEKPELKTDLVYYNDVELQKNAIASAEAGKRYYSKTKKDYRKDELGFKRFLQSETGVDTLNYNLACITLATSELVDSLSDMYTNDRFLKLEGYLKANNNSTAIYVKSGEKEAPENSGSYPVFKIVFSMKDEGSID